MPTFTNCLHAPSASSTRRRNESSSNAFLQRPIAVPGILLPDGQQEICELFATSVGEKGLIRYILVHSALNNLTAMNHYVDRLSDERTNTQADRAAPGPSTDLANHRA